MYKIEELNLKKVAELKSIAKELNISKYEKLKKQELTYAILDHQAENVNENKEYHKRKRMKIKKNSEKFSQKDNQKESSFSGKREDYKRNEKQNKHHNSQSSKYDYDFDGIIKTEGVLEIMPDGYGFMRSSDFHYLTSADDVYVSHSQIKLFGLVTGDTIIGNVRPPKTGEKYFPLIEVKLINGCDPGIVRDRIPFHHLTPLFPNEKFNLLGNGHNNITTRILDMFTPIGKGQRG
ncbi:MAG: transcription termination factor Rho, partial [Flavobacteriales bacterium]|nr:transcription termination factor Rho [Flavobacteriales bacterium]